MVERNKVDLLQLERMSSPAITDKVGPHMPWVDRNALGLMMTDMFELSRAEVKYAIPIAREIVLWLWVCYLCPLFETSCHVHAYK